MQTPNPRVSITLKPSSYAQLKELSRLTGNSQSALIAEIIEQSAPVFARIIVVLNAAQTAKQGALDRVIGDMEKAQLRVEKHLGILVDDFEVTGAAVAEGLEHIARRGGRAVSGDAQAAPGAGRRTRPTPISNRGVRSTDKPQKQRKAAPSQANVRRQR
jgi:predicted DNA-binding protein